MGRLRLRSDLVLLVACIGLYIGSAAQVKTARGSALSLALSASSAPVEALIEGVADTWSTYVSGRQDISKTLAELSRARREVTELRQTNQLLAAELSALRQGSNVLAAFPELADRGVLCRVVARDAMMTHTVRLDRGSADGIRNDSPVISESGVLGRVNRVSTHSSRVQLLTHPAAAAAARIVGVEGEGLLMGGDRPVITGFPPYTKVEPAASIVTTGSEGIYPPGLLLGTALEARNEGIFTVVPIKLAVPPADAVVVLVLKPAPAESK